MGAPVSPYNFSGADGEGPTGSLMRDDAGNLYGTTFFGGAFGQGTVFKLDPAGTQTVLHSFSGIADGGYPYAGVIGDKAGNLYGTTSEGGPNFWGTVFALDALGNETVLYSFSYDLDGARPYAGLLRTGRGATFGLSLLGSTATPDAHSTGSQ